MGSMAVDSGRTPCLWIQEEHLACGRHVLTLTIKCARVTRSHLCLTVRFPSVLGWLLYRIGTDRLCVYIIKDTH